MLSFGCEVWGATVLAHVGDRVEHPPGSETRSTVAYGWFEACLQDPAVRLQIQYMRYLAGVARPAHRVLFTEFGQYPLHAFWARMVVGFWIRIVRQPGTLCNHALRQHVLLYVTGV